MNYNYLFKKGKIGNLTLKNKIVMPAIGTLLATSTGEASDRIIRYYEERAKGGCGLIITEITRVDNVTGVGILNQLSVTSPYQIPRLQRLARAVHKYDTKIFLQLQHPGRQSNSSLIGGRQIVAPSAIACKTIGEIPRVMTIKEIEDLVKKFVTGAKISQIAGIDGIELHGAHGYLIGQFMSTLTNKRTDKYGGNFNNRMRFITEIITGIKNTCGNDFPLIVRIGGDEFIDGGINQEEAIKISKYLESLGINAINVSSGIYESAVTTIEPVSYPEGWKKYLAKGIKENIKIPVIACNNIKTPKVAESLLNEEVCDFIALGRAQLADPEFVKKTMEGREKEIRPCISCLDCIEQLMNGKEIRCAVNPKLGYEEEFQKFDLNGERRVVVVIGGGPAGLEAARILAIRNFKVILFEKKNYLGGSVHIGSIPPRKNKLIALIKNMEYQVRDLGVDIRLNYSPTLKDIKDINPYSVYIAMGGNNIVPEIPGIHGKNVFLATELLEKELDLKNKKIVVVGAGMTGLETAEYLAEKGNEVEIIEMSKKIGAGIYTSVRYDVTSRLRKYGVKIHTQRKLIEVEGKKVHILDTLNQERVTSNIDYLVLALGICSKTSELINDIEENYENTRILGDSEKAGKVYNAIKSAFDKAYTLQ